MRTRNDFRLQFNKEKQLPVLVTDGTGYIHYSDDYVHWLEEIILQPSTPEQLFPIIDGSTPHVCPVCCGRQYAPMGFYDRPMSTAINTELCRTYGGTGIVWRHEIDRLERKEESK